MPIRLRRRFMQRSTGAATRRSMKSLRSVSPSFIAGGSSWVALQSATDPGDDLRGVPAVIELYDVLIAPKTCAKDTNRAGQMTQTAPIEYAGHVEKTSHLHPFRTCRARWRVKCGVCGAR